MATAQPPQQTPLEHACAGRRRRSPWIVALSGLVVIGAGMLYMLAAKPYDRGSAAAGDAVPQGTPQATQGRRQQVG